MKANCIKSINQFVVGTTYKVVENTTLHFKIMTSKGDIQTFSKVYDDKYPNFRAYFEIK